MAIADNTESTYSTENKYGLFHHFIHDMKKSLSKDPHSISDIRRRLQDSLHEDMHLIDALKEHHNYIKESIVVCLDRDAQDSEKKEHLERLFQLFEMHAKAEEQTLYKFLLASSEKKPRVEGTLAQDEHELIYSIMDELRDMHFEALWSEDVEAKNMMICELIVNHLKKEESEIFPLAEDNVNSGQLNYVTNEYLNLCDNFLAMNEIRAKGIFL